MRSALAAATVAAAVMLPGLALAQSGVSEPFPGSAPNAPAVTTPGPSDTTASTPGTASVPGMDMTPGLTTPDSTVVPPAAALGPESDAEEESLQPAPRLTVPPRPDRRDGVYTD